MRIRRTVYVFITGILSGIFVAQGLVVLSHRTGWNFGGEVFVLPLIFLLTYLGFSIGRMYRDVRSYREGYREGVANGQRGERNGSM